ncbi:hypothetical protein [Alicyclobacillus dauci]|uniref:Uncharacterized protein n=1 Tax=Alicyclobacillus dauci TaxID=1475485 RepID=A0ABY6Z4D3_9BACL|nr:hypothetical protein [Alicyclobacillus dauci]WAH36860.1 hypothetical protein NZD86_22270 [Alicyclobacillus dauci]
MATWIWLTSLLSLANCVFLVISGRNTPSKWSYGLSMGVHAAGALVSLLGLLSVIQIHGDEEIYLFSLFGLPIHEGFEINYGTTIALLVLYLCAFEYALIGWRRAEAIHPDVAFRSTFQLSWWTFGFSFLVMSPTLLQAFIGSAICFVGAIWLVLRTTDVAALGRRGALAGMAVIGFLLQTLPTWIAWHALHTVQLTQLSQLGPGQGPWHGPAWTVWLWFVGVLLEVAAAEMFCIWHAHREQARGVQRRLTIGLGLVSGIYIWRSWSVVVASPWMVIIIALAGVIVLASVGLTVMTVRSKQLNSAQ